MYRRINLRKYVVFLPKSLRGALSIQAIKKSGEKPRLLATRGTLPAPGEPGAEGLHLSVGHRAPKPLTPVNKVGTQCRHKIRHPAGQSSIFVLRYNRHAEIFFLARNLIDTSLLQMFSFRLKKTVVRFLVPLSTANRLSGDGHTMPFPPN
jgi:hypothetical protein